MLKPAEIIEPEPEPEPEPIKQKKVWSVSQLEALAKAIIKAQERKKELAELNAKSKGWKEQKLKADAAEFDKLQKQKELEETVRKIDVPTPPPPPAKVDDYFLHLQFIKMKKQSIEFLLTKLVEYVKDIFLLIGNYLYPSKVNSFMEQQIYSTPDIQFSKYKNPNLYLI
jgi:hypothetical protein